MDWVVFGQQLWYGVANGLSYAVFAAGLTLVFGVLGVINMAHGQLYMLGAMLAAYFITSLGPNFFLAAAISVALVGVVGVIVNRVAIQPLVGASPLSVLLSTIAVGYILLHGSAAIWGTFGIPLDTPFRQVLHLGGVVISVERLVLSSIGAATIVGLYLFLKRAQLGKLVRATSQNRVGASLVGINIKWVYGFTFALGAALAATAGVLLGPVWIAQPSMGEPVLITGFVIVIVGGMGNVPGCIGVGLLIGIVEALFAQYVSVPYSTAFVYGIMVIVLAFKPQGLFARR